VSALPHAVFRGTQHLTTNLADSSDTDLLVDSVPEKARAGLDDVGDPDPIPLILTFEVLLEKWGAVPIDLTPEGPYRGVPRASVSAAKFISQVVHHRSFSHSLPPAGPIERNTGPILTNGWTKDWTDLDRAQASYTPAAQ
jgi:hypothetical protein